MGTKIEEYENSTPKLLVKVQSEMASFVNDIKDKLDLQKVVFTYDKKPGYLEVPSYTFFETKQKMRRTKLDELLTMSRIDDVLPTDDRKWLKFFGFSRIDGLPIFEINKYNLNKDEPVNEYMKDIFSDDTLEVFLISCLEDHIPSFFIDDMTGNVGFGDTSPSEKLHVSGQVRLNRNIEMKSK